MLEYEGGRSEASTAVGVRSNLQMTLFVNATANLPTSGIGLYFSSSSCNFRSVFILFGFIMVTLRNLG